MKHFILFLILFVAHTIAGPYKMSEGIEKCYQGGYLIDPESPYAMCWYDNKKVATAKMEEMGFVLSQDTFPTFNSLRFVGKSNYGNHPAFFNLHFDDNQGLDMVEMYFSPILDHLNYHLLNLEYDNFIVTLNGKKGYKKIKDTDGPIFSREYSSCDGDCGSAEYKGRFLDMELLAFMQGRAEQYAIYADSANNALYKPCIKVGVYENYSKNGDIHISTTEYPYAIYRILRMNKARPNYNVSY